MFAEINALQTTSVIRLTLAVSKASYLPFHGSRYIQNGKITENTGLSSRSVPRCPQQYPEYNAGLCYKKCKKRNGWAFVRAVGPVCWGCPSSHPSEEALLCYRNCPRDKPYKSTFNCFGNCPGGYRNDGLTCFRDAHIFGSDNSGCPWYDICGLTFSRGCSKCPSGYHNDGCTCRRDPHAILRPNHIRGVGVVLRSYGRGVGKVLLFVPEYESRFDTPACSIGNWQATSHVNSNTEVLKFVNDNQRVIVFGFRGTNEGADWLKNMDFWHSFTTVSGRNFYLHRGFKACYMNIADWFERQYQSAIFTGYKIILTGHSLGGAEATIAAVYAAGKFNRAPDAVITYGAPLTGNKAFANYYRMVVGCHRTLRFVALNDPVPHIPRVFGYTHVCSGTRVVSDALPVFEAHDLYVGYQNGITRKYGNSISIKAGCDTAF